VSVGAHLYFPIHIPNGPLLLLLLLLSLLGGAQMKKFIAKKMKQQHPSLLLFSLQVSGMCSSYANVLSLVRRKGCQHGFKWV
jgi:hypothetical protein